MAIDYASLATSGSNTDASSYTTASISPTANNLVLAWVYSAAGSTPNVPTVSGGGVTWVQVATVLDSTSQKRLTLFRAMSAVSTSGTVTFDFGGQTQTGCTWSIIQYDHVSTRGTNGSGAIVQTDTEASAGSVSSLTSTLSSFASTQNAAVGGFGYALNSTDGVVGSGFTHTGERNQGSPNMAMLTEFRNSPDTTVDMSIGASSVPMVGISAELAVAKTEQIKDNFDDNSTSSQWGYYNSVVEANGQVEITVTGGTPDYHGYYSGDYYDLTDSYIMVEVVNPGNQAWTSLETELQATVEGDGANRVCFTLSNNVLTAYQTVASSNTSLATVAWNATNMRWWRIRESGGTTYWEYTSQAGYEANTWTTLHSKLNPITMTAMGIDIDAGNWSTETGSTLVVFDNFNIVYTTDRYWVGGTGNWDDTSHWATSSGGSGGASVPTSINNVYFDVNSFSSASQVVDINGATAVCKDMDWTGATNNPSLYAGDAGSLSIYGSLTFISAMSITGVYADFGIKFMSTGSETIDMSGKSFPGWWSGNVEFNGVGGTWDLQDDLSLGSSNNSIVFKKGTLNTNNYAITTRSLIATWGASFTLNLGSSIVEAFGVDFDEAGFTLNEGTSHIKLGNSSSGFSLVTGDETFYDVTIDGNTTNFTINDSNTYHNLTINSLSYDAPKTIVIEAGTTQTITNNLSISGSSGTRLVEITSSSPSTQYNIISNGSDVTGDYLDITDSNVSGTARFLVGTGFVNGGNNDGWEVDAPDITLVANYVVSSGSDIAKDASYDVLYQTNITKDSVYAVLYTPADITQPSGYSIFVDAADITLDASYSIARENLDSSRLKKLKIGEKYGPVTSVVLGRVPQNDNIIISSSNSRTDIISDINTTTNLFTVNSNELSDGNLIRVESTGDLPAPLQADVNYYVYTNSDPDTFALARTYSDAIAGINLVNLTTSGTGTVTLAHIQTQEVQINNNQIMDDDRITLLPNLYPKLVGIEWNEVQATTIGLGWHEVGDLIEFTQGDRTVVGFMSEVHLVFDGSIKETLKSEIPDVATINYQTAGGILKTVYNTEIKVDKQENEITSIVSQQDIYQEETLENFTQVYQDINNIALTVQKYGGGNLIRNSVGFATTQEQDDSSNLYDKFSFWDYNTDYDMATNGVAISYSSSESQNNGGVSGEVIEMSGADISITQRIVLAAQTPLSFGIRVNNDPGTGSATITLSNDSETFTIDIDDATSYDWTELTLQNFQTTLPWLDVTITVDAVTKLQFTDLRIMYGATITGWMQAASEILSTNVQFTEFGMRIFDNVHDTETRVTYNEFSTRRRSDGAVLFEADDSGIVANDVTIKGRTSYLSGGDEVIRQITIPESSTMSGIAFIRVS